jgi:hypothetical protein
MKVSEIKLSLICKYCRLFEEDLDEDDKELLESFRRSAIEYCTGYTGLTEAELDNYADITNAVLMLIVDMYDNRSRTVDKGNINRTTDTILNMHCYNLIPGEREDGN